MCVPNCWRCYYFFLCFRILYFTVTDVIFILLRIRFAVDWMNIIFDLKCKVCYFFYWIFRFCFIVWESVFWFWDHVKFHKENEIIMGLRMFWKDCISCFSFLFGHVPALFIPSLSKLHFNFEIYYVFLKRILNIIRFRMERACGNKFQCSEFYFYIKIS